MTRAYSYVRFSTAEQIKGKSLERQTEAAATYCAQHGLTLDTELSLRDLGVSAFRGKNAATGALKLFQDRVDDGTVPRGSFLLIETFDRMSRESAYDAQLTLQNIISAGVTVVTLLDGKQYSVQILRTDPLALIYAILLMSRGHEESQTKSRRVADAWARKRGRLTTGETLTASTPGWIELDSKRRPKLIPAKAKLVRTMFEMFLEGTGIMGVAQHFNEKKIPTFRGGEYWFPAYISKTLKNRATLGEFQPCSEDTSARRRKRVPFGQPIAGYYPAVIDETTFDRVQALTKTRARVRKSSNGTVTMLAGLSKCPECGGPMVRTTKGERHTPRLVCTRARVGGACAYRSVPAGALENALVAAADSLFRDMPGVDPGIKVEVARAELALAEVVKQRWDLGELLEGAPPKTIVRKLHEVETREEQLTTELEALRARLVRSEPQYVRDRAKRMRDALSWHSADPSDPRAVNMALRECFDRVIVNYVTGMLDCVWKHGPVTNIPYGV